MSNFHHFKQRLLEAYEDEDWSGYYCEELFEIGQSLAPSEWEKVQQDWQSWPADAQTRLAEIMSAGGLQAMSPLVFDMIQHAQGQTLLLALDRLRLMMTTPLTLPQAVKHKLRALMEDAQQDAEIKGALQTLQEQHGSLLESDAT